MKIKPLLNSYHFKVVSSILIGFSLALLFKRTCTSNCIIVKNPNHLETPVKISNSCFVFKKMSINCPSS